MLRYLVTNPSSGSPVTYPLANGTALTLIPGETKEFSQTDADRLCYIYHFLTVQAVETPDISVEPSESIIMPDIPVQPKKKKNKKIK